MKPGDTLGRYEINSLIARGGMAEVWLARAKGAKGFRKKVVIKTILPHLAEDPEFTRMFINEALLAARLNHPHIVQIFDLGSRDEHYYIAMEHVPGRSLRQIVRELRRQNKWIPPWFVLRVAAAVCEGLHYAHDMRDDNGALLGLVHRDVSPENIMVSYTGMVKVLDFGVAKATKSHSFTRAGTLKGKYSYMAPEQIQGRPVDRRIDVYSVGVILYEFLTRRRPFQGTTDLELLKQITEGKVIPPRALVPRMPRPLEEVILRAISRDPDQRFLEAQLLGDELQACLTGMKDSHTQRDLGAFVSALFPDIADQVSDPGAPVKNGKAVRRPAQQAPISTDSLREKIQQLSQAGQPAANAPPMSSPVDSVARTEKWVARVKDALSNQPPLPAAEQLPPPPAAVQPVPGQPSPSVNNGNGASGERISAEPSAPPEKAPEAPERGESQKGATSTGSSSSPYPDIKTGPGVVDTDVETPDIDELVDFSGSEIVFTYIKRPGEELLPPKKADKAAEEPKEEAPAPAPEAEAQAAGTPSESEQQKAPSPFKTERRRGKKRRRPKRKPEQAAEVPVGSIWGPKRESRRSRRSRPGGIFSRVSAPTAEEAPSPDVDPEVAAEAARHFDKGLALLRRGEPELALVEWEKAADLNPHEQTYRFNIQHLTKKREQEQEPEE